MSDHSSGSSGSSSTSWTLLSPDEAALDPAGPVDDGTESVGDVPSLSEEVTGSSFDVKPSESEAPQETVLSEEGHQVCQETSPELSEEGAASGPSLEADPDICAPVIHATITTSPPDNDLLGAVPFSLATESALFLSEEPYPETFYEESLYDVQHTYDFSPKECSDPEVAEATPEFVDNVDPASEPVPVPIPALGFTVEAGSEFRPSSEPPVPSISDLTADVSLVPNVGHTPAVPVLDVHAGVSSCSESSSSSLSLENNFSSAAEAAYPETPAFSVLEEKELVTDGRKHESISVAREAESLGADEASEHRGEDSGLRQRRVHYAADLRRSSDEEDREETEFKLPDRKEEKPGLPINYLIIGALALLCLGSLFFSDDFDGSGLSDQELLEKLVEENKQISILEAQIQAQKEELDRALRAATEKGITDKQHTRMKEELSLLPSLKEELETLKTRVSELTQLTGEEPSEPPHGFTAEGQGAAVPERQRRKKDELKRQKTLLEQSKTRLEGMRKQDLPKKWLRERLVEMQQRLSDHVDCMGKKDEWRTKHKHKDRETRTNEWGDGIQKHKELVKKYRDEWEDKKAERKLDREMRKQERSVLARSCYKHKQNHKVHQHQESKDFWKHQEKKLRRNQNPPDHCHDVSGCAEAEGLIQVTLSDFRGLLNIYLNKLHGLSLENKEAFHRLIARYFHGGVFSHDRMLFSEFAEDVADILEDLADVLMDDSVLEEEMEEFEKEALWRFAAAWKSVKEESNTM